VPKVSVPDCAPITLGLKVTVAVQLVPAARLDEQLLVTPKAVEPLTEVTDSVVLPVFVSWTVCAAEVVPTFWLPNARDETLVLAEV
jgi:hypothetical protein